MTKPHHAVIDLDLYKYAAAFVGEKRTIEVTHKTEGWSLAFKNRTKWYGHWKKREGGKLAEINSERDSPYHPDEFNILDIQTPEPIANVLHTAKLMVEGDLSVTRTKSYEAYLGKGDSFRVELSTLMKYKDRGHLLKPLALDEVSEYLQKKFKAEIITGIEADDMCVIAAYKRPEAFVICEDKDYWGTPVNIYDINQRERGIVNCNKFGHLFLDSKGKVRGEGRMHFYWQVLSEDSIDGYAANCFSDVKWAAKSAYSALKDCENDKEAWQVLVDCYKNLYPQKKTVTGWRGNEIEIDWLYVLTENFWMAHMKRSVDEPLVDVKSVIDKIGVNY